MSVKDLIRTAMEKDASAFEQTFDSVMGEKAEAAIAAKYDEMFSAEVEEEFDSEDSVEEGYKKKMKEADEDDMDDEDEEEEEDDEDEDDEDEEDED